jgi:hypothetical protein
MQDTGCKMQDAGYRMHTPGACFSKCEAEILPYCPIALLRPGHLGPGTGSTPRAEDRTPSLWSRYLEPETCGEVRRWTSRIRWSKPFRFNA